MSEVKAQNCFWCEETKLILTTLPEWEGKQYAYYLCPDCGTGYIFTDTDIIFIMPAREINAHRLWNLEQAYKRTISRPGGGSHNAVKKKKVLKPLNTERYRL
ncbi:MAG: hypothetical protein KGZ56_00935 [Dethiobacter sp.]|nr:hypothetical protein [Dethiobacter sp.]MBS3898697.1 hypothetical protein [Dethiobacter sp.]